MIPIKDLNTAEYHQADHSRQTRFMHVLPDVVIADAV